VTPGLPTEIAELCQDRSLGSSALLSRFLALLPELDASQAESALTELQTAFPVMAVWVFLQRRLATGDLSRQAVADLEAEIRTARRKTLDLAVEQLARYDRLLTISRSSLVEAALVEWAAGREGKVLVGEGLPAGEGRALAGVLAQKGLSTKVVPDWELVDQVSSTDAVVLGADWVMPDWFINKTGSSALVRAARGAGKQVIVLAEAFKATTEQPFNERACYQIEQISREIRIMRVFEWIPLTDGIILLAA